MFRRRPDPRELASVLHRLERLQIVAQPAAQGWLPHAPYLQLPPMPATARRGWRARVRASVPARLHVTAFDPGRRGVAVLVVLAVVGASGGAWYFLRAAPHIRMADADPTGADCQTGTGQGAGSCLAVGGGSARSPTESVAPTDGFVPVGTAAIPSELPTPSKASDVVVDVVGTVARPGVLTLPPAADTRVELMPGEPVELRLLVPAGVAWLTAAIALLVSAAVGLMVAAVLVVVGAAVGATMLRGKPARHHVRARVIAVALLCAAGAAAAAAWRVAALQRGPLPSLARAHATVTLEPIVTSDCDL